MIPRFRVADRDEAAIGTCKGGLGQFFLHISFVLVYQVYEIITLRDDGLFNHVTSSASCVYLSRTGRPLPLCLKSAAMSALNFLMAPNLSYLPHP